MAYLKIHRSKQGRLYLYQRESYRIPGVKKPKKREKYLGALDTAMLAVRFAGRVLTNAEIRKQLTMDDVALVEQHYARQRAGVALGKNDHWREANQDRVRGVIHGETTITPVEKSPPSSEGPNEAAADDAGDK
jgi:hypothetical protein